MCTSCPQHVVDVISLVFRPCRVEEARVGEGPRKQPGYEAMDIMFSDG